MAESSPVGGESESENVELLPRRRSACNWGVLSSPASSSDQLLLGGKSSSQTQPTHLNFSTFFSFFSTPSSLSPIPCPMSLVHFVFCVHYLISSICICHQPVFYATGRLLLLLVKGQHILSAVATQSPFPEIQPFSLLRSDCNNLQGKTKGQQLLHNLSFSVSFFSQLLVTFAQFGVLLVFGKQNKCAKVH